MTQGYGEALPPREGVYWIDGTKDLFYGVPELLRRPATIGSFLAPYAGEKVFAVLDRDDLRPLAKRYALLGASALRRIIGLARRS